MAYTIGIDFGTESGRVILLNLITGDEAASAVVRYSHGVIDTYLPTTGERLPSDWALQHPQDYIDVIKTGIRSVLEKSGVDPVEVVGLGIDFTSCTVLPVTHDGLPLCFIPEWANRKHAWPKLWKHHAAQRIADRIVTVAEERGEAFLSQYGGRISSEWYFPKLIEIFEKDKATYDAMYAFVEATDWIVWYLTGNECRNSCTAGYKAMWNNDEGIPDAEFFKAVYPEFVEPDAKLGNRFYPLGTRAGVIREELADELGLQRSVAVAVGNVDAHVSVPGAGVSSEGSFVMVIGTSICHLAISSKEVRMPGITGVVRDGVLPGYYGYEAGQAAVGDMLAWFTNEVISSAEPVDVILSDLDSKAGKLRPGECGLVSLDWWNGNRSILANADLSGMILGMHLGTSVVDIYRSLLESIAFGTRRILENFEQHKLPMHEIVACGGIARKNAVLMQIYADICQIPVKVMDSTEIPARGSALFGAVAAGSEAGGFDDIEQAVRALPLGVHRVYEPNPDNRQTYDQLYEIYRSCYEMFGVSNNNLMFELKGIRRSVSPGLHQM